LQALYGASKKTWMADMLPEDADGGELSPDGRVMEMLSEHTLVGWLEGYLSPDGTACFTPTKPSRT
jgi:xylulose-5-phosphate/fructose-6-phosphate phosphoketolase